MNTWVSGCRFDAETRTFNWFWSHAGLSQGSLTDLAAYSSKGKNTMKFRMIALVAILFIVAVSTPAQDAARNLQKASLVGMSRVYVVVNTTPQAEQDGLTSEYIKTEVESRLRTAGIKVIDKGEWAIEDGILSISISALPIEKLPLYACSFTVDLKQTVIALRDRNTRMMGATWQTGGIAAIARPQFKEAAKRNIVEFVESFINDYKVANPRK
jgi:hypothetical protein